MTENVKHVEELRKLRRLEPPDADERAAIDAAIAALQREAAGDGAVWKDAVVEACMRIESGYVASDPRATLHAIEEWWYQLGVEQTANSFLVEKANAPRPTGTEDVAET